VGLAQSITLTPPADRSSATEHVQTGPELREHRRWKTLGEDVCKLRGGWYVQNLQITDGDPFTNEVKINLDVLGMLMLDWVGRHVESTNVVTIHQCSATERGMKLLEKLAQPRCLSNTISYCTVLGFRTGS